MKKQDECEIWRCRMICLKIKEMLDKVYWNDIITNVTYVTIM